MILYDSDGNFPYVVQSMSELTCFLFMTSVMICVAANAPQLQVLLKSSVVTDFMKTPPKLFMEMTIACNETEVIIKIIN